MVAITVVMMVAEIVAGTIYGSMALLADGWHMGTHAAALGVALFAYTYARRHSSDPRHSFGTGKVGALGGVASAVGLAVVALLVFAESVARFAHPVTIQFNEAIGVAVVGLVVNLGCAWLFGITTTTTTTSMSKTTHHRRDHDLRAAYVHVLADALTSIFAIGALLTGKFLGWTWMDPVMGIVGAAVITRWSLGSIRDTGGVLLDAEVAPKRRDAIRLAVEISGDARVVDLHLWRVGPRHLAAIVSVVTSDPMPPRHYKTLLDEFEDLAHVTVEVNALGVPEVPGKSVA